MLTMPLVMLAQAAETATLRARCLAAAAVQRQRALSRQITKRCSEHYSLLLGPGSCETKPLTNDISVGNTYALHCG